MSELVLDASALIAMIREEAGGDEVAKMIGQARMSVFNYAEVVSHFIHAGMNEGDVDAMLDPLPIELVPADKALARMAGRLRATTASSGLSLGDRFCLALSLRDNLPAWTADRQWKNIERATGAKIELIR